MDNPKDVLNFFIKYASKKIGLVHLPNISFVGEEENKHNTFGHFMNEDIVVRITNRHPVDVMRTIIHEMVHWKQKIENKLEGDFDLQEMEDEANSVAGRVMREFNAQYPEFLSYSVIEEDTTSAIPANSTVGGGVDLKSVSPILGGGHPRKMKKMRVKTHQEELQGRVENLTAGLSKPNPNPLNNTFNNGNKFLAQTKENSATHDMVRRALYRPIVQKSVKDQIK